MLEFHQRRQASLHTRPHTCNRKCVEYRVYNCASFLVSLKRGGLEDKGALNEQEDGEGVQQWVVGEEDEVGLKHRCPNQSSQYEYSSLCQYGCGKLVQSSKGRSMQPCDKEGTAYRFR